jgi:hypothetical protein
VQPTSGSPLQASIASYHLHKGGGSESDYEDAFAMSPEGDNREVMDVSNLRIAISDGASESVLAGLWARSLVDHFVRTPPDILCSSEGFAHQAVVASKLWDATLSDYVAQREAEGRPIQWYEQPKIDRGAYATLLTVGFSSPQNAGDLLESSAGSAWSAAAIGDCVLFHVREDELITAFPMTNSADFGFNPDLLNSRNRDAALIADRVRLSTGTLRQGDDLYICSDALAAWFLGQTEHGCRPWELLRDLGTVDGTDFTLWINEQRLNGHMGNDDVTLLHLDVW